MSELMKQQNELSTDINTITAEINAYQRVAGEAIFEIGRRLHRVKYNPSEYGLPGGKDKNGNTIVARGAWGEWLESVNMNESYARKFETIFVEIGGKRSTLNDKGMSALYEIAQLPPEQREAEHVTSKGEIKTPDEMTVKELRELKRQLKETEKQAEAERKERERLEQENEELSSREPEVRVETKTEYIEVRDEYSEKRAEEAERRLKEYEDKFGDIRNYDEHITATHRQDMIVAVMSLSKGVREFIKRYDYMTKYKETIDNLDDESVEQYNGAIKALKAMADSFEYSSIKSEIIDVDYEDIK